MQDWLILRPFRHTASTQDGLLYQ